MNFNVVSRQTAEDGNIDYVRHAWISITDPAQADAAINVTSECQGILRLKFHDMDPTSGPGAAMMGYIAMTEAQGQEIVDFVDRMKNDVNVFFVHCEAGISRSAGVAAALSVWLNGNDDVIAENPYFMPNAHVKSTILRLLWDRLGDEE